MDKAQDAINKAQRAKSLLESAVLQEAIARMREDAIRALLVSRDEDLLSRRADVLAIDRLVKYLQTFVTNGKIAQAGLTN